MLIDCHTHTALHSRCSSLRPAELCSLALKRGLSGLVITEHRRQWRPEDINKLRKRFPDLGIYSGVELSLREGYDVVLIAGERLFDFPQFPDADQLAEQLQSCREDVFSFVAHPFRYRNFMTPELKRVLRVVEGIEMNSVNILKGGPIIEDGRFAPENEHLYVQVRQEYDLAPVFNSDTHGPESVATVANDLRGDALPKDAAALGRLLREGAWEWQNALQIEAFLESRYLFI